MHRQQSDVPTIVGIALMLFMAMNVLRDQGLFQGASSGKDETRDSSSPSVTLQSQGSPPDDMSPDSLAAPKLTDAGATSPPYDHYAITQGPHSFDFGQIAIDISAGKGAIIKSPINGIVTGLYIDEWGNTTLLIENDLYVVTLLHGLYTVKVGDKVIIGQPVGQESNQGNTIDAQDRSCRGRDCGYHTHLNIFDKLLGVNLDPLRIFGQP